MTSSLRPGGTVSVSMSVTKPYWYSRSASCWISWVAVVIASWSCKPCPAFGYARARHFLLHGSRSVRLGCDRPFTPPQFERRQGNKRRGRQEDRVGQARADQ